MNIDDQPTKLTRVDLFAISIVASCKLSAYTWAIIEAKRNAAAKSSMATLCEHCRLMPGDAYLPTLRFASMMAQVYAESLHEATMEIAKQQFMRDIDVKGSA